MTRYGIVGRGRVGSALVTALEGRGHEVRVSGSPHAPLAVEELADSEVVVECVSEDHTTKVEVLGRLRAGGAVVLTTTSSFTVADLARDSGLGDRLGGFHHLPSYGGGLAEIVGATPEVHAAATALADDLGLEWIDVVDRPGRISRRLLVPFLENVLQAEHLGIAPAEEIDTVVELGLGHAVGPLRRLRDAGLDDHRAVAGNLTTREGNR